MREGVIHCSCGAIIGFNTISDTVACPGCGFIHQVEDYIEAVDEGGDQQ